MYKCFLNILINRFFLIGLIFLIGGCGNQAEPPKKPDTVSKMIAVNKKKPAITDKTNVPNVKKDESQNSNPEAQTQDAAKNQKDSAGAQAAQAEGAEEEISDVYDPIGKIDPFEPLIKERRFVSLETKKKKQRIHLTPLEKIDLSQLKLSAIVLATSGNRAIVSEADGKGYVITKGTYIGINSGRVAQILSDKVIVEEEVENILGRISIRKRELKLQKPPGE